jgi:hypothetical protein
MSRKATYKGETYTVVLEAEVCDVIEDQYEDLYSSVGLDTNRNGLRTINTPDGDTAIINSDGESVGYSDVPANELVFM